MNKPVPDSGCCPLCGEANNCTQADKDKCPTDAGIANQEPFACWCMAYSLDDNGRRVLEQKLAVTRDDQQCAFAQNLPQQTANSKTCLCQRCLSEIAQQQ